LSSDDEHAETDFWMMQELTVQACGRPTVQAVCILYHGFLATLRYQFDRKVHRYASLLERSVQKRVANFDDFEKDYLRRTIFIFCDKGEFPTAKKLVLELTDKINYSSSVESPLYNILKSTGFKYRETNDGHKFLTERGDILAVRIKFLRTVHNLRIPGGERPVFYLDELWVNQNH
jgi:hypothetical protein